MSTVYICTFLVLWLWSTVCIYKLERGKGFYDFLISAAWFITIPLFLLVVGNVKSKNQ